MSECGIIDAAIIQNAAEDGSPGIVTSSGLRGDPPVTENTPFVFRVSAPNADSARSVWSRVAMGSLT